MKFTKPQASAVFTITAAPVWPAIVFETDVAGPHSWKWTLQWDKFSVSGTEQTASNSWNAGTVITNRGGSLTVVATCGGASATLNVLVKGTNATEAQVVQYLATKPGGDGFQHIIRHETKFRHFNSNNDPVKSFDAGYGMCQLTNPPPSFEQAWNWQRNVDGGLALFAQKVAAARTYLSQSGRTFTPDQLTREAVCRWNGGSYHRWDAATGKWVRPTTILCDSKTGNIGWDMTDPANTGHSEAELHARDQASYSHPPGSGAHWKYLGVCYADRVLS